MDVSEVDPAYEFNITITGKEFENKTLDLLNPIQESIIAAIDKIDYSSNQIDKILQVGGGCRMPLIKQLLESVFPHADQCCVEHPDEVVAIGAAYYSCFLSQSSKMQYKNDKDCSIM